MNNSKKRIVVYIRNKELNPSNYYRIHQYLRNIDIANFCYRETSSNRIYYNYHFRGNILDRILYALEIYVRAFIYTIIDNINTPDCTIISREVFPRRILLVQYFLEKRLTTLSKTIWDFDDSILEYGEISRKEWRLLENNAQMIITLNDYLKRKISERFQCKVLLLSTTDGDISVSLNRIEERKKTYVNEVRLIWLGTASNIDNLQSIIPELEKIKDRTNKKIILTCVCNRKVFSKSDNILINNVLWSREAAIEELNNSHIGLMPLKNVVTNNGKGAFKIIQYLCSSLPVVASPIGMNKEVITSKCGVLVNDDEWAQEIIKIAMDVDKWEKYSFESRKRWEKNYSYNRNLDFWLEKIENLFDKKYCGKKI